MPEQPGLETAANLFADTGDGVWADFKMVVHYVTDHGLMQMGRAGPTGSPSVIIRTHAPITTKVVSWQAAKSGGWPTVPTPEAIGDNDVFLAETISPAVPVLTASGRSHIYSISGTYTYALRYPAKAKTAGLPSGTSPIDRTPAGSHKYPPSIFRGDLLGGTEEFRNG